MSVSKATSQVRVSPTDVAPTDPALPGVSPAEAAVLAQRHLYIAWVRFQRRPLSMGEFVGYQLEFLPPANRKWAKPFGYVRQAIQTIDLIRRTRPDIVWIQSPPSMIVHLVALIRLLMRPRFKIVADCHNGALDPRLHRGLWANFPGVIRLMNGFDVVLAHNAEIHEIAARRGVARDRLVTLETRPSPLPLHDAPFNSANPIVLVPCSFQADEPILELFESARRLPHMQFRLTGNKARAEAAGYVAAAPANVSFTGFLQTSKYTELLCSADIVLGLTTVDGVQLSAANEAIGAGRPLVLSDMSILRALFGDAALFADNDGKALSEALAAAATRLPEMREASRQLKIDREMRWREQMKQVLFRLA